MQTEQMKLDGLAWEIKLKARMAREFPNNPGLAGMYYVLLLKQEDIANRVYGREGPPPVEGLHSLLPECAIL